MAMARACGLTRSRRWRGFSLFGVLLGLAVAGAVIVGAVSLFNTTQESAGRTEIVTLVSQLKAGVHRTFAGRPNYGTGNLMATLDLRGAIPDNAAVRSSTGALTAIQHPFNAAVTITGATGQFTIALADLDNEICAALLDVYVGQTRARTGLVQVAVGSTTEAAPITVADVATLCDDGAGANDVTLTFG